MEAVRLRNIGKVTCRLSGYATVVVVTETGRRIPEVPRHGSYFGAGSTYPVPSSEPADLTPGQTGGFLIGQLCPAAPPTSTASTSIRSATIYLPHGEGSVDFGGGCFWSGWWDSELGRLIQAPVLPPAPKWPLGSSASIDGAPGTVRGGTTLHYVVGYSDPSVQLGRFTPCPGYTETLTWPGASYSYSYLLNCGALRALGSGKAAKLAMEIHVPDVPHLEIADLIWRLNTPGWGPEQELSVDISPSSPSIAASTTTTTTPLNGNVISGIKPQVDLAATPKGWVPVAYGDAQVSVPADWLVLVHDCMTIGASVPGVIFIDPLHETRTACRGGPGKIPETTVVLNPASPGDIPKSVPAEIINGVRVYQNPAGPRVSDTVYLVPALGIAITVDGLRGQQVLHTLTWSPRSVVLAKEPASPVPSSWQDVSFDGVSFSVPASWPVAQTSVANELGWPCGTGGTELSGAVPEVSLSTDTSSTWADQCPAIEPVVRAPGNGVDIDKGANSLEAFAASFSGECRKLHGLTACPATGWPYSVLALRVSVPRNPQPVYVAIGLAGNGVVARTILYSLRAASPSRTTRKPTGVVTGVAYACVGVRVSVGEVFYLKVSLYSASRSVASETVRSGNRYRLTAAPGVYTLKVRQRMATGTDQPYPPRSVVVRAGRSTTANFRSVCL
jgi:hypothetical protein